jgi:nuclear migration protein JNM1
MGDELDLSNLLAAEEASKKFIKAERKRGSFIRFSSLPN